MQGIGWGRSDYYIGFRNKNSRHETKMLPTSSMKQKCYPLLRKVSPNEPVDMTEINGALDGLDEPDFI